MTLAAPPTLGLVLAGGRGRRLGGADKALVTLAGRPLLVHVAERAAPQCAGLVLGANEDPDRFQDYGWPVVADADGGGRGPLAGIAAGLRWLRTHRPELHWLATFPVDCPFLPWDLIRRLHQGRSAAEAPLAAALGGGRAQPTVGLWPLALAAAVEDALAAGELSVAAFLDRHGAAWVPFPSDQPDPFSNLNQPSDLAAAETALAGSTDQRP